MFLSPRPSPASFSTPGIQSVGATASSLWAGYAGTCPRSQISYSEQTIASDWQSRGNEGSICVQPGAEQHAELQGGVQQQGTALKRRPGQNVVLVFFLHTESFSPPPDRVSLQPLRASFTASSHGGLILRTRLTMAGKLSEFWRRIFGGRKKPGTPGYIVLPQLIRGAGTD